MNISILENAISTSSALSVEGLSKEVGTFQSGCYCLYCRPNGRFYIGSSAYMGQRKSNHFSMLARSMHSNGAIQKDYNLHGKSAFTFFVLKNCEPIDLEKTERDLIASLKSPMMYNSNSFANRSNRTHLENSLLPIRETSANSMSDKMNKPHVSDNLPEGSLAWLAGMMGVNYDTLYRKARRRFPEIKWSSMTELTPEQTRVLSEKYSIRNKSISVLPAVTEDQDSVFDSDIPEVLSSAKSAELSGKTERLKSAVPVRTAEKPTAPKPEKLPTPDGVPAATENDTAEKEPILRAAARVSADILAFVIVIGHAGLLWYDCATLWGIPGQIGGGIVFAAVLLAVLICTQSNLPRSSNTALWFVLFVDIAAWWVHFEVFKTPVVSDAITGSLCAFICASSFVALYLFRDSKLD